MPHLPSIPRPDGRLLLATLCLISACKSAKGGDDVGGPTAAIALNLSPGSASVAQGGSSTVTGTLTRSGGFTGDVNLFLVNAPSTVTATAILQTVGATTTATITVQVGATTPAQTYDITIMAQASGVATATAHFMLTVTAQQGYAILGVTPSGDVTLAPGATDNTKTLTISRFNYTAALALTAENLPAGLTVSFSPSLTTGNSAALSITAGTSVTPGNYTILLRGTGPSSLQAPGEEGTANFTAAYTMVVNVTSGGSFTLGVTPSSGVNLQQGTSDNSRSVTITRNNYPGAVTLAAENLPTGLTAAFAPSPTSGNSSTLTLTAAASLAPNSYTITIRGTGPAALKATGDSVSLEATTTLSVTVTAAPASGFALGITPAGAVSVQQGTSNNTKTVTINRTNYSSNVTLAAENLPAGLTAAFSPNPASGTSSTLTLSANGTVAPNTYTITIRGTGPSALDATVTVSVTVTAAPAGSFTLSLTPSASVTLQQGSSDNSRTVGIARTNYTASVTLTAENLPTGLTAAFAPNPASGTSATLTLTASGTVAANTYAITIRGTGPAALRASGGTPSVEATVTLTVTVTAPAPVGPFNVTYDFSACDAFGVATHLFVRDGNGPWVRIVSTNNVYSFTLNQAKAGVFYRIAYGGLLYLHYYTSAELAARSPYLACPATPLDNKPFSGTVTGGGPDDEMYVSYGDRGGRVSGDFTIYQSLAGTHDVVAYLAANVKQTNAINGPNDRIAFIRDKVWSSGMSVGTINLSTGTLLVPGTLTVLGMSPGETMTYSMNYRTGATCDPGAFSSGRRPPLGTTSTMYGVAANQQRASDFHQIEIENHPPGGGVRMHTESFHTMGNYTVTLLPPLPVPTVTKLPASYLRLRAVFEVPVGYQSLVEFSYTDFDGPFGNPGSAFLLIRASMAYLGGPGTYTLETPDMTGVSGWTDALGPGATHHMGWDLHLYHVTHGGNRCAEAAKSIHSYRSGSVN
jgi:uncharacterized membrane protein